MLPLGQTGRKFQLIIEQMQSIMESCPAKTVMSGTMGFALGGAFGLFMASVRQLIKTPRFISYLDYGRI
jgi:hypothetical protein